MTDQDPQQPERPKSHEQANAQLRRLGFPEIPPEPTTKQDRVAARLRRMGITPASDQQTY